MLPGCVPKQSKVFARSEHPYAVEIKLALRRPPGGAEDVQDQELDEKKRTFFVNPEFKPPKQKEVKAAVAEATGSGDAAIAAAAITTESGDAAVADAWDWGPLGAQPMPPF